MNGPIEPDALDRRVFLKDAAIAVTAVAIMGSLPAIAAVVPPVILDESWQRLVAFLTGKGDLSAELVARGYAALRAVEADFEQRVLTLKQRIAVDDPKTVEEFRQSLPDESELLATTLAIISAYYLGHVGKGLDSSFVSFEEALMYRPTADVTVIPTHSPGPPGYWVAAPKA